MRLRDAFTVGEAPFCLATAKSQVPDSCNLMPVALPHPSPQNADVGGSV